jgi:hypothetical protein
MSLNVSPIQDPSYAGPSCCQKIVESKWTDLALAVTFVAFLAIGILSGIGTLNFIGVANASYLFCGTLAGAFLTFVAEILKISINCGTLSFPCCLNSFTKKSQPLSSQEMDALKKLVAQNSPKYGIREERWKKCVTDVINNAHFQNDPTHFMEKWEKERGDTKEIRDPEDFAYRFFIHSKRKDLSLFYFLTLNKPLVDDIAKT